MGQAGAWSGAERGLRRASCGEGLSHPLSSTQVLTPSHSCGAAHRHSWPCVRGGGGVAALALAMALALASMAMALALALAMALALASMAMAVAVAVAAP